MSFFSAPKWEVDESSEKISRDVFGSNISPLKGKIKSKKKNDHIVKDKFGFGKKKGQGKKQDIANTLPNAQSGSPSNSKKNSLDKSPKRSDASFKSNGNVVSETIAKEGTVTNASSNGNSPKKSKKQKKKALKMKGETKETSIRLQDKFNKILQIGQKKKKAQAVRQNQKTISVLKTPPTEAEGKLLAKKSKRQRQRENNLKKMKEGLCVKEAHGNEIVLSNNKKKKMKAVAKSNSKEKLKKGDKNGKAEKGTTNPSFDTSFPDELEQMVSGEHQLTNLNKKKKKKKKNKKGRQTNLEDSVDGNFVSSSWLSSQDAVIPSVGESPSYTKEPKKKKVLIEKLLKEASIKENITLHDLKKKRQEHVKGGAQKDKWHRTSLKERMSEQLKSARFRWLNEQLYSSSSSDAVTYFKEDPEAYDAYHSGYRNQVAQWPLNPVDVIVKSISSLSDVKVVADFGCGDAKLAEALPNLKVHSLDLVASKPGVIACDMAHTPLLLESVDVVVFCLSLMGTNLNDFILEANRVLKKGGLLMIAEVESRFEDIDNFTSALARFGFQLKKKDLAHQLFIFMDFKKVQNVSKTGKLPVLALEACVYKRR